MKYANTQEYARNMLTKYVTISRTTLEELDGKLHLGTYITLPLWAKVGLQSKFEVT